MVTEILLLVGLLSLAMFVLIPPKLADSLTDYTVQYLSVFPAHVSALFASLELRYRKEQALRYSQLQKAPIETHPNSTTPTTTDLPKNEIATQQDNNTPRDAQQQQQQHESQATANPTAIEQHTERSAQPVQPFDAAAAAASSAAVETDETTTQNTDTIVLDSVSQLTNDIKPLAAAPAESPSPVAEKQSPETERKTPRAAESPLKSPKKSPTAIQPVESESTVQTQPTENKDSQPTPLVPKRQRTRQQPQSPRPANKEPTTPATSHSIKQRIQALINGYGPWLTPQPFTIPIPVQMPVIEQQQSQPQQQTARPMLQIPSLADPAMSPLKLSVLSATQTESEDLAILRDDQCAWGTSYVLHRYHHTVNRDRRNNIEMKLSERVRANMRMREPNINLSRCALTSLPLASLIEGKHITLLDLSQNYISILPDWLFQTLSSVSVLNLSHNYLCELPQSLSTLKYLHEINLSYNQFEFVPPALLALTESLDTIDLSHNRLCLIPNDIHKLKHTITDINLSHNNISKLPRELKSLKRLRQFKIYPNRLFLSSKVDILPELATDNLGTATANASTNSDAVKVDPKSTAKPVSDKAHLKQLNAASSNTATKPPMLIRPKQTVELILEMIESERKYLYFLNVIRHLYYIPLVSNAIHDSPDDAPSPLLDQNLSTAASAAATTASAGAALSSDAPVNTSNELADDFDDDTEIGQIPSLEAPVVSKRIITKMIPYTTLQKMIHFSKELLIRLETAFESDFLLVKKTGTTTASETTQFIDESGTLYFSPRKVLSPQYLPFIFGPKFMRPMAELYAGYLDVYERAIRTMSVYRKSHLPLETFLRARRSLNVCYGLDLDNLLLLPYFRPYKYYAFVKSLKESGALLKEPTSPMGDTEQGNYNSYSSRLVIDGLREVVAAMDRATDTLNNRFKVVEIERKLRITDLAVPQRRYVRDGKLKLRSNIDLDVLRKGNAKDVFQNMRDLRDRFKDVRLMELPVHVYLFNDCLIMRETNVLQIMLNKTTRYSLVNAKLDTSAMDTNASSSAPSESSGSSGSSSSGSSNNLSFKIVVTESTKPLHFQCDSKESRDAWLLDLQTVLRKLNTTSTKSSTEAAVTTNDATSSSTATNSNISVATTAISTGDFPEYDSQYHSQQLEPLSIPYFATESPSPGSGSGTMNQQSRGYLEPNSNYPVSWETYNSGSGPIAHNPRSPSKMNYQQYAFSMAQQQLQQQQQLLLLQQQLMQLQSDHDNQRQQESESESESEEQPLDAEQFPDRRQEVRVFDEVRPHDDPQYMIPRLREMADKYQENRKSGRYSKPHTLPAVGSTSEIIEPADYEDIAYSDLVEDIFVTDNQ